MRLLKRRVNRRAYEAVRKEAEAGGDIVCAYRDSDGRPHYFTMPKDTPDTAVRDRAFQLRTGRAVSPLERDLLAIAERLAEGTT